MKVTIQRVEPCNFVKVWLLVHFVITTLQSIKAKYPLNGYHHAEFYFACANRYGFRLRAVRVKAESRPTSYTGISRKTSFIFQCEG